MKFCSRQCCATARSLGLIGSRPKLGYTIECMTCGKSVYRKSSHAKRNALHFCSESCRIKALHNNEIDLKQSVSGEKKRDRVSFKCCICGTGKHQKRSYFDRNVNKTCGNRDCISAYGRSLWKLPPFPTELRKIAKGPSRRPTNFTAKQRNKWLGNRCVRCGATDNLCLDHIIPVCAGGTSTHDNAQTLCQPCNNLKVKEDRLIALAVNNSNQAAKANRT